MNIRTMAAALLAVLLLAPQSGCKIRKKYRSATESRARVERERDSLQRLYRDSLATLHMVRREAAEAATERQSLSRIAEDRNLEIMTEKGTKPVELKGETYRFTADWTLDSAAVRDGQLVYFDADNPALRARIYRDSGRMKIEIQTKDRIIDVPVDRVTLSSRSTLKVDSGGSARAYAKAITMDSAASIARVRDSAQTSLRERLTMDKAEKSETRSSSKSSWFKLWWLWAIAAAVVAFYIIRSYYGGGYFDLVLKKIRKWIR